MSQVLVRDLDPELMERLKHRAQRHGRSLQAELKTILEETARADARMEEARRRAELLREQFADRTFSDSSELIREDRDR
jgi:plasmid stability protein